MVKEAGGDEELAKKMAIERAQKNDPDQIQVEEPSGAAAASGSKKKKKKSKDAGSEKKEAKKKQSDDILDELDMDL